MVGVQQFVQQHRFLFVTHHVRPQHDHAEAGIDREVDGVRIAPALLVGVPDRQRAGSGALDVRRDPAVARGRGAFVEAGQLAGDDRDGAEEAQHARREAGSLDHVDLALHIVGELVDILAVGILRQVEHVAAVALEARR
ncbi:hypothetical protein ACVWZV_008318 [Bradyrhizobium sp. GM5.1]